MINKKIGMITIAAVVAVLIVSIALFPIGRPGSEESESKVLWHKDIEHASAIAGREGKTLLLYFYSTDCGLCAELEANVYQNDEISSFLNEDFINVKINVEKNPSLLSKYNIFSVPATIFAEPDGTVIGMIKGYIPPQEFYETAVKILQE